MYGIDWDSHPYYLLDSDRSINHIDRLDLLQEHFLQIEKYKIYKLILEIK